MERSAYEASLLETIQQLESHNAGLHQQIEDAQKALAEANRIEKALLNRMNAQSEVITMLEKTNVSGQSARRLPQIYARKTERIRNHKSAAKRLLQRPAI